MNSASAMKLYGALLVALVASFVILCSHNDYMTTVDVYVTVLEKRIIPKTHKVSEKNALLYKTDDGIIFQERVSESTYKTSPVGERYKITLRPFDMKQTGRENVLYFFGPIVLFLACLAVLGLLIESVWLFKQKKAP